MKNKPTLTNNNRNVHMAIFKQTKESGATWFSTTLKRPYKNRQGQWEHGISSRLAEQVVQIAGQRRPYTLFGVVDAITRIAGRYENAGDRLVVDQKAASLLSLAV